MTPACVAATSCSISEPVPGPSPRHSFDGAPASSPSNYTPLGHKNFDARSPTTTSSSWRRRRRHPTASSSLSGRSESAVRDFGGSAPATDVPGESTPARRPRRAVAPGRALGLGKGSGSRSLGPGVFLFDRTSHPSLRFHAAAAQWRGYFDHSTTRDAVSTLERMRERARRVRFLTAAPSLRSRRPPGEMSPSGGQ